jgi:cyanophycin synthetase
MTSKDIVFQRISYLRGPNIWTYRPVIEAWVDIGAFEELPSNKLPGFTDRLVALLPGIAKHRCGVGEEGGFIERLRDGTWMGHILEHVGIELQNLAGSKVGFGKTRQIGESTVYKMAMRTRSEIVGRAALHSARELLLAVVDDQPFDLPTHITQLTDLVDRHCFGPSTACIVDAAGDRRIPWISLNGGNLVQMGHGFKQRRIWTAETDRTSAIAESIASDKDMTKQLLAAVGVPVPEGQLVDSPEAAWEAANDIGFPVAVKPVDGNHGRGITLDLRERADIEAAYALADAEGSEVMVERFILGTEHRLLVVDGKLVAAARGEIAQVIGDGTHSVQALVDLQINTDPRRGVSEDSPLNRIEIGNDPVIALDLQRQGHSAVSVPRAGESVLIQRNGNVAFDCTELVHPDVAEAVGLAARVVGLDIAGVDLVAQDISRPLEEQGGAIVEVNAGPGLLMHLRPAGGTAQPVGQVIGAYLFPEGDNGRIPLVAVTGTLAADSSHPGTTEIARLIAWLLRVSGKRTGLACAHGLYIDRRQTDARPALRFETVQSVLMNRSIEAAVLEIGAQMILSDGLPYDWSSVAVVTDVRIDSHAEALAPYHISTQDQMRTVARGVVDTVLADGLAVLNADDAGALDLAELCDGAVVLYSEQADNAAITAHRANNAGRAVYCADGQLVLATGDENKAVGAIDVLLKASSHVKPAHLLAAFAATWGMGLSPELIRAGIKTYIADRHTSS